MARSRGAKRVERWSMKELAQLDTCADRVCHYASSSNRYAGKDGAEEPIHHDRPQNVAGDIARGWIQRGPKQMHSEADDDRAKGEHYEGLAPSS